MNDTYLDLELPPVSTKQDLTALVEIISAFPELRMNKYGDVEPFRATFNPQSISTFVDNVAGWPHFYWYGRDRQTGGVVYCRHGKGRETAAISIWTQADKLTQPHSPAELLRQVVKRFGASYGFVHHLSSPEITIGERADTVTKLGRERYSLGVSRWKLVRCVPDLYWVNVFGPEYTAMFGGAERVHRAPAYLVEELAKDVFWMQLTPSLRDVADNHSRIIEARRELKPYLGADCFFDPEAGFERSYRVPELGWKEPIRKPITLESLKRAGIVN